MLNYEPLAVIEIKVAAFSSTRLQSSSVEENCTITEFT